jgi:hypothetical protein
MPSGIRMAQPSSLPADLHALVAELDAVERDADALVAPLSDEQFNWPPAPGGWSIGQCLGHLNAINAIYMAAIERAVDEARRAGHGRVGPIASTWVGRHFIASMEPPPRLRMRSPRRARPHADHRHKAEVWPEFVRFHAHARKVITTMADVDLNRAVFGNPWVGGAIRMRAGTGLRVITAHERRHIWQAWRVRESEAFPR